MMVKRGSGSRSGWLGSSIHVFKLSATVWLLLLSLSLVSVSLFGVEALTATTTTTTTTTPLSLNDYEDDDYGSYETEVQVVYVTPQKGFNTSDDCGSRG